MEVKDIPRKEFLKPGLWETALSVFQNWLLNNKKLFFGICVVVALVIGGIFGGIMYADSQKENRKEAVLELRTELNRIDDLDNALSKLDGFVASNPELKNELILIGKKVDFLVTQGNADSVISYLLGEMSNEELPGSIRAILGFRLADYYFENGRVAESIETLSVLDSQGLEDMRLFNLALAYLSQRDYAKAKEQLNLLINGFPNSLLFQNAQTLAKYL